MSHDPDKIKSIKNGLNKNKLKKNKLKKVLAFVLALVFVLPVFPFDALANYQNPIQDFTLTDYSTSDYRQAGSYSMNLKFTAPTLSSREDSSALNGTGRHDPEGFDLYWRNVTASENYQEARKETYLNTTPPTTTAINKTLTPSLEFGSLYMYKMVPWHTHQYRNPAYTVGGMQPEYLYRRAPMESEDLTTEILYLSDIRLSASGTEKELTVVWDNPTFMNNDLFTSYKFFYASGGTTARILETSYNFEVDAKDPALLRDSVTGKLSYTLKNPDIKVGTQYAIKVVPLYNGRRITEGNLKVAVGGKEYPISSTNREYRTDDLNVKPSLEITREGKDFLKLSWNSYLTSLLNIDSIEIFRSDTEDFANATNLGKISSPTSKLVNFFLVDRPNRITYYKAVIWYLNEGSTTPVALETVYAVYNPAYEAFDPIKPTILQVKDTDKEPFSLDITWEAFVRRAYSEAERVNVINSYDEIIDKGILYDVYVTDDITNFDSNNAGFLINKIVDSIPANMLQMLTFKYVVGNDSIDKPAYKYSVNQYVTNVDGEYLRKDIVDNKIYYIMIIAKRDPSGETSARAYYSHYYAPKKDIFVRPIMLAKPPLRIKKDKDGIEVITKDSITIQWETNWYEVYNDSDDTWYSKIGIDADGRPVFGKATDELPADKVIELNGSTYNDMPDPLLAYANIRNDMSKIGVTDPELYPLRFMDLKDAQYDINVTPYDFMETSGGYDTYLNSLTDIDWQTILPTAAGSMLEYEVRTTTTPNVLAVDPNTAYTILLRPFTVSGDNKKEAYFPNYIVATTLSERPPIEIIPTVPIIEAVSSTDTTITVRFEYLEGLSYELFWNELLSNYPDKGIVIDNETLKKDGQVKSDNGKNYMYFTINRLFPETVYHVWVRSYSDSTGITQYSDYSNPVSLTTRDMSPPQPPEGLGPVAKDHLDILNKENQTTWFSVDYNYMIIEWFRDPNDPPASPEAGAAANAAAGGEEQAKAEALSSPNIPLNYIVKFNDLIGNKGYYLRAKTILTITKTETGIAAYYQYVVQLSPDINFTDVVEITVPSGGFATDPVYTMVKESSWSRTIRLVTSPYTGEYDGDKTPDTYPLPKQDFEILYDKNSDTLTYRFRSDEIDKDGNKDNRVDQRFISNLVQNRAFNVNADLSAYNGKFVTNGVVELPYSILRAFKERKISLSITLSDTTFTFMPGFVETAGVKALANLGDLSKIKIKVSTVETGLPPVLEPDAYVTQAKKLSVSVTTATNTVNLTDLANLYKAELKITNRYLTMDKNTDAYTHTDNDVGWIRAANSSYERESGNISIHLQKLGTYSAIAKALPKQSGSSDNAIYTVATLINITDMKSFNAKTNVTSNQLNKLMSAIASGKKDVALNEPLTDEENTSLTKSGLLTEGEKVTKEAGLNALIRLYELKTKKTIKNFDTLAQTPYKDIVSASQPYQTALLKAAELGFFDGAASASPKANMTIGDMLRMADFIIQDAGL